MLDALHEAAPRLVVLLVLSPAIGAAIAAFVGRGNREAARHAAIVNSGLTATISLILAVAFHTADHDPQAIQPTFVAAIPWLHIERGPLTDAATGLPHGALRGVLSFGVDRLSIGPLTWLPWLLVAALIGLKLPATAPTRQFSLLLWLESGLLATFAAQDAITFCLVLALAILVAWGLIAGCGEAERRQIAGGFARVQASALMWSGLGLAGLGISAAWCRQEFFTQIPPIDLRWPILVGLLPDVVRQSVSALRVWDGAESLLFLMTLLGLILRGPFAPLHTSVTLAVRSAPPLTGLLLIAAWPIVTGSLWLRIVVPVFPLSLLATSGWLTLWAAATVLAGGIACWRTTSPQVFAARWTFALQGLAWMALIASGPEGQRAGWLLLQAAGLGGALWLCLAEGISQRAERGAFRRWPRWTLLALAALTPLVALPAVTFGPHDVQTTGLLLLEHPLAFAIGATGWFATSWAALRRLWRLCRQADPTIPWETSASADLTASETIPWLTCAAAVIVAVGWPVLWRGWP